MSGELWEGICKGIGLGNLEGSWCVWGTDLRVTVDLRERSGWCLVGGGGSMGVRRGSRVAMCGLSLTV